MCFRRGAHSEGPQSAGCRAVSGTHHGGARALAERTCAGTWRGSPHSELHLCASSLEATHGSFFGDVWGFDILSCACASLRSNFTTRVHTARAPETICTLIMMLAMNSGGTCRRLPHAYAFVIDAWCDAQLQPRDIEASELRLLLLVVDVIFIDSAEERYNPTHVLRAPANDLAILRRRSTAAQAIHAIRAATSICRRHRSGLQAWRTERVRVHARYSKHKDAACSERLQTAIARGPSAPAWYRISSFEILEMRVQATGAQRREAGSTYTQVLLCTRLPNLPNESPLPQAADAKERVPFQVHAVGQIREHRCNLVVTRQGCGVTASSASAPLRSATSASSTPSESLWHWQLSLSETVRYPKCRFSGGALFHIRDSAGGSSHVGDFRLNVVCNLDPAIERQVDFCVEVLRQRLRSVHADAV